MGSGGIKKRSRTLQRLFKEQKGCCYICGRKMAGQIGWPNTATIDHVEPKLRKTKQRPKDLWRNPDRQENKRAACYECNQAKGRLRIEEFLQSASTTADEKE